jgi:acyl-CoA synthetase (NDP forming)
MNLDNILDPQSIAIIGASGGTQDSWHGLVNNLIDSQKSLLHQPI